jgi:hypothetical protein
MMNTRLLVTLRVSVAALDRPDLQHSSAESRSACGVVDPPASLAS